MRRFLLIVFGLILGLVGAAAGYVSYRVYLILPDNTAPSQAEYPQAAIDLMKIQFDNFRVSPPDSYNIYSFFLASKMLGTPSLDKDMFSSMIDGRAFDQSILNTLPLYLRIIDLALVDYWFRFWWDDREILRTYLGISHYGGYQWKGLEEASQGFFGVSAKDLSLPEMAVLVVNLQAPYGYDPLCGKEGVHERVLELLDWYKQVFPEAQFDVNQMFVRLQPRKCYADKS